MSVSRTAQREPPRATYQDVLDAPEHQVAEIIDGTLYTHPRPAPRHATATSVLGIEIGGPFDRGRGGPGGWRILDEPELHLGEDILVPDLAGWRRERMPELPDTAYFTLAPDWTCEILSASTRKVDRRPATQAPDLRPRRCPVPVAHRPSGPHPRGLRAARRAVAAHCERTGRRASEHPAVRCDHVQPGGAVGLSPTAVYRMYCLDGDDKCSCRPRRRDR